MVDKESAIQPQVLIIEDEVGLREILEVNFRGAGYQVHSAGDGVAGWQQFERHNPDLLVLDLKLPQLSGFRLLELIRSESDVPVLILTAYDFAEAEEVARFRPDAYVKKPFDVKRLLGVADRLLGRAAG